MRKDKNLTANEINELWDIDPNRALYECTYRTEEIPSLMDDPGDFISWLKNKYVEKMEGTFLSGGDISRIRFATGNYENGKLSLSDWLKTVRSITGGEPSISHRSVIRKPNPEVDAYTSMVNANFFRELYQKQELRR